MTTNSDASQAEAVELPPLPDLSDDQFDALQEEFGLFAADFDRVKEFANAVYHTAYDDIRRAAIAQDRAARAQAEPKLPEGWVPCLITYEGDEPEEVAFGPQRMMDRLKKWLTSYFEHVYAERYPAARAQAEPVAQLQGTFACPICGQDTPHGHSDKEVAAYRYDQVRRDSLASPSGTLRLADELDAWASWLGAKSQRGHALPGRPCIKVLGEAAVALRAIPQAAEVPGFVLVPREPTREMIAAYWDCIDKHSAGGNLLTKAADRYRAMLAAAPTPTAGE